MPCRAQYNKQENKNKTLLLERVTEAPLGHGRAR